MLRGHCARALGRVRARLFTVLEDEADVVRMRRGLTHLKTTVVFCALRRIASPMAEEVLPSLDMAVDDIEAFVSWEKMRRQLRQVGGAYGETSDELQARMKHEAEEVAEEETALVQVLSAITAHALLGSFAERQPLMTKLPIGAQDQVRQVFGEPFLTALAADTPGTIDEERRPLTECDRARSWFPVLERRTPHPIPVTTQDLPFPAVENFRAPEPKELIRARQYRLFPSRQQSRRLRGFMGTARWTYNQCVAYQRAGNRNTSLSRLDELFVTKDHGTLVDRPDGVKPLPNWVFDTPCSIRNNVVRQFRTALAASFTNQQRRHINRFTMHFKSRKQNRYFTITEVARCASLREPRADGFRVARSALSISKMKNIACSAPPSTPIKGAVNILHKNGFWYVSVPIHVTAKPRESSGRCTACDPGVKAFLTTFDLNGNAAHYGRGCWEKLEHLKLRQRRAQSIMSKFKASKGKHTFRQWHRYAKARREFHCATAKIRYRVDALHYQACARLTQSADVVVLPRFGTSSMLLKSSPRTHTFNYRLLTLSHYRFRQRLQDVCERKGVTLVICSEMYTSRTCGRCNQLHLSLGNNDVFRCPQCDFQAGRDENAAFNILRFVCAGALQVFTVNNVAV